MSDNKDEPEFKWLWKVPEMKKVKQPEILTPDEFLDLVIRIDNVLFDPLMAKRNQCMLLMTYFSCFRAIEVCQWQVKEALYPDGSICQLTRLRKEGTKGNYAALAPVVVKEQRDFLDEWFNARVTHRIGLAKDGSEEYRGLDPESHVFLSFHHGRWKNFSLTRKVTKGNEYFVATSVQNLLTKFYKEYGFSNSSSHAGRHSFARFSQRLLKKKGNKDVDKIIQNLLHHRTEDGQKSYTDIDFDHIRKAAQQVMPRPKKRGPKPKKK